MAQPVKVSEAEWQVMEVIWARSPLAAGEVVAALEGRGWSPPTIKTMLNRLIKKRALAFTAEGKRYLYRPRVSREVAVRAAGRSFVDRLFGGNVGPMLAHFVQDAKLTPEQIRELRKLLDAKGR